MRASVPDHLLVTRAQNADDRHGRRGDARIKPAQPDPGQDRQGPTVDRRYRGKKNEYSPCETSHTARHRYDREHGHERGFLPATAQARRARTISAAATEVE